MKKHIAVSFTLIKGASLVSEDFDGEVDDSGWDDEEGIIIDTSEEDWAEDTADQMCNWGRWRTATTAYTLEPSSSGEFSDHDWWSTAETNYVTGDLIEFNFHPKGLSHKELQKLVKAVKEK